MGASRLTIAPLSARRNWWNIQASGAPDSMMTGTTSSNSVTHSRVASESRSPAPSIITASTTFSSSRDRRKANVVANPTTFNDGSARSRSSQLRLLAPGARIATWVIELAYWTFADSNRQFQLISAADQNGGNGLMNTTTEQHILKILDGFKALAIKGHKDVAQKHTGRFRRARNFHMHDEQTGRRGNSRQFLNFFRNADSLHHHADVRRDGVPLRQNFLADALQRRRGNCDGFAMDQSAGHHAQHLPAAVDQRSSGKAGIKREIRSNELVDACTPRPPLTHDTAQDSRTGDDVAPPGPRDGGHQRSNLKRSSFCEHSRRLLYGRVEFQEGKVAGGRSPGQPRPRGLSGRREDLDASFGTDCVGCRQHVVRPPENSTGGVSGTPVHGDNRFTRCPDFVFDFLRQLLPYVFHIDALLKPECRNEFPGASPERAGPCVM